MKVERLLVFLVAGVILLVAMYAAFIVVVTWPVSELSVDKAGVFGDSFGILTSLFSGLAFAGIIATILLQREELKLQRAELALQRQEIEKSREELKRSAQAQEQSAESIRIQSQLLALSALASIEDLRGRAGYGFSKDVIDKHYQNVRGKLELLLNDESA